MINKKGGAIMMEKITHYLQDRLSEDEALELWKELLFDEEPIELLETYYYLSVAN